MAQDSRPGRSRVRVERLVPWSPALLEAAARPLPSGRVKRNPHPRVPWPEPLPWRDPAPERRRAARRRLRFVMKNRRRPTLPGGCPPSTIGAERLNCSVRNGKRCLPFAMHHRNFARRSVELENCTGQWVTWIKNIRQALEPLVPVRCTPHGASTAGLSSWWSTSGLTLLKRWENSSRGGLPA